MIFAKPKRAIIWGLLGNKDAPEIGDIANAAE